MQYLAILSLFTSLVLASQADMEMAMEKGKKPCCNRKEPSFDCGDGCGGCFKNYVQKMDFYHTKPILTGAGKNWNFFLEGTPEVSNDGILTADCHGGKVDSTVFTRWLPPNPFREYDGIKYFIYAATPAVVPKQGDLVVEFEGTGEVFRGDQNPFPKEITQLNDFRYGHANFATIDFDTSLSFRWIITNDRVYAVYARYPFTRDVLGDYASFEFVIPVKMRKSCDWHNMKTILHGSTKQVSWRLDGHEVFRVTKVGYLIDRQYQTIDYAGQESPVFPETLYYGFGTGTEVQAYPACKRSDTCCDCKFPTVRQALTNTGDVTALAVFNPLLGPVTPAVFWQNNQDPALAQQIDFIWGQGATLGIRKLVVYQDLCAARRC